MSLPDSLIQNRVFYYFNEICKIPHGSGDMVKIADFCVAFAESHKLKFVRDSANNVVIYKEASDGYERAEPIILQGHLDMVCQSVQGTEFDFLNSPIEPYVSDGFIKADGTTLGADNGIAVAMILAVLESNTYSHPPLEAVFTTDEEIGMVGALQLDTSLLKGKKMINIDSEEDDTLTVSCAGGRDFTVSLNKETEFSNGTKVVVKFKGLQGGHSGVEIDKGRINADILAGRFLNHMNICSDFRIISINGGTKSNAIVDNCEVEICAKNPSDFINKAEDYLSLLKCEMNNREMGFSPVIVQQENGEYSVLSSEIQNAVIFALVCSPQGVIDMSTEIEGLVETSQNLGILKTTQDEIFFHYSFRSNKKSAIDRLEERMRALFSYIPCKIETFGDYPSWSFNPDSTLQKIYKECYETVFTKALKVSAIHAGLECGVFASSVDELDCISVGPNMFDVHTTSEKLSIDSTEKVFEVILKMLEKCK